MYKNPEDARANHAAWRAANPEKEKAYQAAYRAANPEKEKVRHVAYRAANPEKMKAKEELRAANPEKEKVRHAAYHAANREKIKAKNAAYRASGRTSANARMRNYGLTPEAYQQMLLWQQNACAICKEIFSKPPNVDHCHKTGEVRGLLCSGCNRGLGYLGDSLEGLERAKGYLTNFGDKRMVGSVNVGQLSQ